MDDTSFGQTAPPPFERRPQAAYECVDTVKMSRSAGSRVPDDNAGSVNGRSHEALPMSVRHPDLRTILRFLIGIFETLPDVDIRLHRYIRSVAGDVRRTDVLKPFRRHLCDQVEDVFSAADIHPEDFFSIFLGEGQRSCAMP